MSCVAELTFNLTPDPKVLLALTRTPLRPMDALCELIDNALDSFRFAEAFGTPVQAPLVTVDLPGGAEVDRGAGLIRIRDNGLGLTPEMAENALRAGYSSNNPYDSLGLFGMGFNISTGKLGRKTVFRTTRSDEDEMLDVEVDLIAIQKAGGYDVPARSVEKIEGFQHGTIVEVSDWWPKGDANSGFARKLAEYSKNRIREQLGRRYATVLKEGGVRILVNGQPCNPFEHCFWSGERYVERVGHGQIPARLDFDESVGTQRRCSACFTLVPETDATCPACGSASFRSITQRIRGWLGVQRFDHQTDYGVDLIRNGRAIRVAEKAAFFEYVDDFGRVTKDYPIDQQYGRLVGEVHLDHVPVDFQKQDFERSTPEWSEAMRYLRGASSLQPNQPGARENQSPMFRLYQGYRKVRNVGTRDMYMGVWEPGAEKAKRVSRELEQEYYERFKKGDPGFRDDAEWWRLVEQADVPPVEELVECPECHSENLKSAQECAGCGYILIGRDCPHCGKRVLVSAQTCPHCGQSQMPEDTSPWACAVCGESNNWDADECGVCGFPRNSPPLASSEYLRSRSQRADELSRQGLTVRLADDSSSTPVDVEVYLCAEHILPGWQLAPLPIFADRTEKLTLFVDPRHEVFTNLDVRVEALLAAEIAHFIYTQNQRLVGVSPSHSVSFLASSILAEYFDDQMDVSPERIREETFALFTALRRRIAEALSADLAAELYDLLDTGHQEAFATNLIAGGRTLAEADAVIASGEYLDFLEPAAIVSLFVQRPDVMLSLPSGDGASTTALNLALESKVARSIATALEECSDYLDVVNPSPTLARRVRSSLEHLRTHLTL